MMQNNNRLFIPYISVALLFFLGINIIAISLHIGLKNLLSSMMEGLFIPGHNICDVGEIGKLNINSYFYILSASILVFSFLVIYIPKFLRKIQPEKGKWLDYVKAVGWVTLIFVLIGQTAGEYQYFLMQIYLFQGRTLERKHDILCGYNYKFSQFCLQHLKGKHWAELVTDYDLTMTLEPYVLSYYLYPRIDVLLDKNHSKDCLIVFNKKNAQAVVPKGYQIVAVFDETSLIAVKK